MRQRLRVALMSGALLACVTLASSTRVGGQGAPTVNNLYAFGPQEVTISTRAGQVVSILSFPAGVEVIVHLLKGTPRVGMIAARSLAT
jgi:hypothetical protein